MATITTGDLDYARRLVAHQLKPQPGVRPLGPDALANMRENIASAPAFSFHLRFVARVLERVIAMHATLDTNGVELPHVADFVERFRRATEAGEPDAIALIEQALHDALDDDRAATTKANAHALAVFVALVLALLAACAHGQIRRACRDECEPQRGPTWSWWGGPTVPPPAFEECMDACEARSAPPDPAAPEA